MSKKKYLYSYQTIMRFDLSVRHHFFKLRSIPCENDCQQIEFKNFNINPTSSYSYGEDVWGNGIQYGSILDNHDYFVFVSSGIITLTPYFIPDDSDTTVFTIASTLTIFSDEMNLLVSNIRGEDDMDKMIELSARLHNYMEYTPNSTHFNTTASEAFSLGMGVCQDYSHILIALGRRLSIPCRYVNGLLTGLGETHAWVEFYYNGGWYGIDSTNNKLIEYGYIKISHGRDAADCPVNRGVFTGNTNQQNSIRVIVEEI